MLRNILCLLSSFQVNQKWIIVHCETLPISISSGWRLEGFALTSEDATSTYTYRPTSASIIYGSVSHRPLHIFNQWIKASDSWENFKITYVFASSKMIHAVTETLTSQLTGCTSILYDVFCVKLII